MCLKESSTSWHRVILSDTFFHRSDYSTRSLSSPALLRHSMNYQAGNPWLLGKFFFADSSRSLRLRG